MHPDADTYDFRGTARFQGLRRLGSGGMGVVYEALDRERNTRVALKTLRTLSAEGILRFKNEFRRLQDIQHPNLVTLGELFFDGGQWFFTMELVDGLDFLTYVRPTGRVGAPSQDFTLSPSAETFERLVPQGAAAPATIERAPLPPLDGRKLRAALAQLARGLSALHAAQRVHRDIKPSNILVNREGRLVLLDFGLVIEVEGAAQSERDVVGTADYMAPEQAASRPVGPAADWYSAGVLLYEALTGQLPYSGAPLEVLIAKQRGPAPDPRRFAPDAPPDLSSLCIDLLRVDPAARPTAAEVLKRLGAEDPSTEIRLAISAPRVQSHFVGRSAELDALAEAFQASRFGQPATVFVEGESGVGKSALVRRFIERLRAEWPDAVVLAGRCYERESVPYKGIDGTIDALARYLERLPRAQVEALLPERIGLVAQVFPVLRRLPLVAQAPERTGGVDPLQLRERVFAALRELFARLCAEHPLALVVDDLQWADADSRALLGEVLHPPDAPPLLLVATVRQGAPREAIGFVKGDVRRLPVARLPPAEARELAAQLIQRTSPGVVTDQEASAIAEEAGGHPLFIDELVRHALQPSGDTSKSARLHLEAALWARIRRSDETARRLLELITVAAGPLRLSVAARAMEIDPSELERQAALLRGASLVRSSGRPSDAAVETYHDRVRAAVFLHLEASRARELHGRLARALEAEGAGADPEALSTHFRAAGDDARAADYADRAAAAAMQALAFARAARLYQLALELKPEASVDEARDRYARLGEALANIGRGSDAALALLEAAKRAGPVEGIELERRAAQQLLVSGHIDEGLAGLRLVLSSVGLELAETPRRALASLLLQRARLRLRGLHFRERETQVAPERLRRIDVCWSVAVGLGMVDPVRSADFQTRHVLLALAAGEPYRVARALAMEGAFVSVAGPPSDQRAQALLDTAQALAERLAHPHAIALAHLARAVNHFLNGRFQSALKEAADALEILHDRCTDVTWEVSIAHQFVMQSLALLGSLGEMSRRMPKLRRLARERGDLYAGVLLRSSVMTPYTLAADDPESARQELAEGFSKWSQRGFHLQHFWELAGRVYCDLYVDDGRTALDRMTARWPVMERSQVLRVQAVLIEALSLRGSARLATASRLLPSDPERQQLLDAAARDARRLERLDAPWAGGLALLLAGGVAAGRGERARATAILDEAARAFDASEMRLHAAVARFRRGQLLGAGEGARLCAEAEAWMQAERIKNPRRMAALFAPEFPDEGP